MQQQKLLESQQQQIEQQQQIIQAFQQQQSFNQRQQVQEVKQNETEESTPMDHEKQDWEICTKSNVKTNFFCSIKSELSDNQIYSLCD